MKNYCPKGFLKDTASHITPLRSASDRLGFLTALTVILTAAPSMAAENKITDLEIAKNNHQLELKLSATNQADASFYTLRGDNIIEANILNTSLDLPEGNSFKQDNPMAGVKALEINQIDNEHTQILISTEANTPVKSLFKQEGDDLILTLNRVTKADTLKQEIKELGQKTVTNLKQTYKSALGQSKDKDNEKTSLDSDKGDADSDVLIPNPEVVIDDNRVNDIKERVFTAQDSETELNDSTAPATLPRAAAPPVGDMAVSNINTMPDMVDLGSSALVSNLVLRDAPVREVLSMLAKTANLSLVYADGDKTGDQASQANGNEETGPTISLDLDNQPVQEVFNSVLLISGLDANRRGNIIYVGEQLPAQARNLVSRTIRLNQVTAENAALYLASQGAKGKRLTNEVEEIIDPETGKVVQRKETSPELSDLDGGSEDETGTTALMLKGLQVSTDGRLNAITLVGEPRKVEVATSFLTQLDARRRQVSVNVKVIDVNLLNQDTANSSFSYGVNDTYFLQDGGSASLNFGGENPGLRDNFTFRPVGPENEKTTTQIIDGDATVIRDTITIPKPSDLPDKFLALIESRITSGNAKVLTDPTLTVQEGQQATVRLVQKIVETVKTELDGDSGARTITPVLGEAGLVLTVNVDRIDDNGFVSMTVSPSVSSIGATQSFESGGGARNTLNLLSKREVSSGLIRLRDGQTLILSGIIQDQERTNVSKVPILGDIPLLGSLFRSTDKTNERAEVIVLLTPEIVEEDAGLASNFKPSKESREMLQKQGVGALGK
ncbi:secretin N-terminal domain-containing protein [Pleurocapsa sp. CCALA 161]|uniref:secretin N-terminal domain-containing protein n=1 Tax=Pleurocapsa sp. CCALA 161 TaxID=2107688 RepID=UPI001E2F5097|nr:secretin N-terminal domain-containing protein [Pleurocapsa sp. CCALA 161]